jgi:MoaA/NifB/PqqE/SkfB family radical SAM enzyme
MYNLEELLQSNARCDALRQQVAGGDAVPVLRSLKFKIISNCNLRCEMCKYWQITKRQLPIELIERVLDEAARLGCIKVHFSGGEVTLHSDLTRAIAKATAVGMRTNLTSNGILMTKERAREWIDAGLRAACFSLDGVERRTHDKIRGVAGAYRRTVRAIRTVTRENERRRGRLRVRINMVLSARNLHELPGLISLAAELGAVDVLPMPVDGKSAVRPTVEQIEQFNREVVPRVMELRRKYNMPIDAGRLYPLGRTNEEMAMATRGHYDFHHYRDHLCYAPYLHSFISHTGEVFACCMTRDRIPALGNIVDQSLEQIFLGPAYRALRASMNSQRLPICAHCDQYLRENRLVDGRLACQQPPRFHASLHSGLLETIG